MTTTRTTKEINTPNGHKVLIYDYLTGGEARKIQALYLDNISADDLKAGAEVAMSKVPISVVYKAQEEALKTLLLSVDGCQQAEAYQTALDLKEEDLDYLMEQVDEYTSPAKKIRPVTEYIAGRVVDEMIIVYVCEIYGWDYETYMRQPTWFIDLIIKKIGIDSKKAEARNKKS